MPVTAPPTPGLILAGGLSRRMGGGDKPLLRLGGRPLLSHVVERLQPQCDRLLLNANGDQSRFAAHGLPVVADTIPDFAGPLAGILAGLDWLAGSTSGTEWLVTVAADTPFIPADLVLRLHRARAAAGTPLASAGSAGRQHHAIGLWPVSLRDDLRAALLTGERRLGAVTARLGVAVAEWPAEPFDPFFNINTPEDLSTAEHIARQS
ncbi:MULTISPECIES: molybdenum cofactor guanylyltransferase MobA [unclassified Bosea (in: a-proteobacteria)]|uniref:molybdenum cofactor guanylyltransferase MobA n=1 Tax=unclassified Bosea (in: a-proteobacteria) TaxID=2653178 RepID=UPI0009559864|nr:MULTISPECIES: molybdenum cofactor guanylyltransferase MobA [unclassified Bosea (in: a-proteobacteria)]SIQ08411.1 molybdenum cofactor guanylyltransferase [Bosea sp. TND4EK4]